MFSVASMGIFLIVVVFGEDSGEDCVYFGNRGPTAIKVPANQTVSVGDTVTFYCEGDFGCGNPMTRSIDWLVQIPGAEPEYIMDFSTEPRYDVSNDISKNGAILFSAMEISGVEGQDFQRTFHCIMSSAREINPTLYFAASLKEQRVQGFKRFLKKKCARG